MKLFNKSILLLIFAIACLEVSNVKAVNHGVFYRMLRAFKTRNIKGVLARKITLERRINRLTDYSNGKLTTHSIIKKLEQRHLHITLAEMKSYLAHLIDSIEWLNKKLKKLQQPLIDESKLVVLKEALAEMNSTNFTL